MACTFWLPFKDPEECIFPFANVQVRAFSYVDMYSNCELQQTKNCRPHSVPKHHALPTFVWNHMIDDRLFRMSWDYNNLRVLQNLIAFCNKRKKETFPKKAPTNTIRCFETNRGWGQSAKIVTNNWSQKEKNDKKEVFVPVAKKCSTVLHRSCFHRRQLYSTSICHCTTILSRNKIHSNTIHWKLPRTSKRNQMSPNTCRCLACSVVCFKTAGHTNFLKAGIFVG